MKTTEVLKLCILAITENETGGNPDTPYRFSDPDGEHSGKSGWSFGVSQFDTQNNAWSWQILSRCGFSAKQIISVINQDVGVGGLNTILLANKQIIDVEDKKHISESLEHVLHYCGDHMSRETLVHLVDYHNQFYITPGGKMHTFIRDLGRLPVPPDVLALKLSTLWGKKRPDDVQRRYDNIKEICEGG